MFETKYKERQRIISLINELYTRHGAGGYLHIVLDDYNIQDCFLESCLEDIQLNKTDIDPIDYNLYADIIHSMKQMSRTQRIKCVERR